MQTQTIHVVLCVSVLICIGKERAKGRTLCFLYGCDKNCALLSHWGVETCRFETHWERTGAEHRAHRRHTKSVSSKDQSPPTPTVRTQPNLTRSQMSLNILAQLQLQADLWPRQVLGSHGAVLLRRNATHYSWLSFEGNWPNLLYSVYSIVGAYTLNF